MTDFAVTRDGEKIANPRHLARKAQNLARYQRRLARCRNGSANRAKAAAKAARAHRKVRDARGTSCTASTRLVRENDVIVIEDLRPTWSATGTGPRDLRLRLGRVPPPACVQMRAVRAELVVIDRWYPSARPARRAGTCSRS